jgi:branched-chain amino acid transport system substrate-binding protein
MKRLIVALTMGAILLAYGVVGPKSALADEKVLKYGILSYLTGPAAPWGIPNYRSISLGAWKVNDQGGFKVGATTYKWEPVVYDTKYVPAEAVKAANKAIYSDKVSFISIGGGACAIACVPLLKEANMLSLNFAGGGKGLTNPNNSFVFRYNPSIEIMYASILPYLIKQHGIKNYATINPDDETGRSGLEASQLLAGLNNLKIITTEFFERGTKEFSPLLTRVISKNPDMIETSYTDPTSSALILKQARELGYKGVVLLAWGPDPREVLNLAGKNAEGGYMAVAGPAEPQTPAQKDVYDRFVKKFPAKDWEPNIWPHTELIPCLTKAIVETQSFDPNKLAAHLEKMTWDSPMGTLWFGGSKVFGVKRQLMIPLTVMQARGGKAALVGTMPVPTGILD